MTRNRRLPIRDLLDFVDQEDNDDSFDNDAHGYDIAFIPAEESGSDEDSDFDEEPTSNSNLPNGNYEFIRSCYSNKQKLLEPSHHYDWKNGCTEQSGFSSNRCDSPNGGVSFDIEPIKHLVNENSLTLFQIFFSKAMKFHIIEASKEKSLNISSEDFDKFLTVILISIVQPRKSERDFWSQKTFVGCPTVKSIMTRHQFTEIKRKIRFYKTENHDDNDKVWKVRALYNIFRKNISRFGFFDYNLSVDEVMVKYFGRFSIKQCIRTKPVRFGIKEWALCGIDGFLYDVDIYQGAAGKDQNNPLQSICLGSKVVLNMLEKLLKTTSREDLSNYHVFFDNFFTSPDLLVHLERIGLGATGTVRQNRVKKKLELPKKSKRGTCVSVHDAN